MGFNLGSTTAAVIVTLAGCASASDSYAGQGAGAWRFDPARCPDLVEDIRDRRESRRDERYDHGRLDRLEDRLDRRESRRDERITICPKSAWVWDGPRQYRAARPAAVTVYYDTRARRYFRYGPRNAHIHIKF